MIQTISGIHHTKKNGSTKKIETKMEKCHTNE